MKKIVIVTLLLITFFTGCNQTPSTTVINNMSTQDNKNEETESVDINELSQILIYEEPINETLELDEVTLTINGIVSKPDTTEGLYTYFSEFRDYEEYLPKMFFLFGEYQDRRYLDGELFYRVDVPEIEYWAYVYAMPQNGFVTYLRATVPVPEDEIKVKLSNEEAISMANDILNEIGVTEVELYSCNYEEEHLQITPDGELSGALGDRITVKYYQNLQGVPAMSTLINKVLDTKVSFCSRGIFEVRLSISDYTPYYKIEDCISYEEALEKFKEKVSKDDSFNGVNIDKVLFEYIVKNEYIDGEFVTVAEPYWHFYRETPIWMNPTETDVVVNAITGVATIY